MTLAATPVDAASSGAEPPRLDLAEDPARSLTALVLTVVELLRQLMERQAVRRMEHGDLTPEQIERVGATLLALDERMTELRERFGLDPEDLNLDLGPLGSLLPAPATARPTGRR